MRTVQEITQIILSTARDYGTEIIPLGQCVGRVLAEDLVADRDFPPFDRVSYDGIAIRFEDYDKGQRLFPIIGMQAAGAPQTAAEAEGNCVEIMTGAVLTLGFDTIVQYEWLDIKDGKATILDGYPITKSRHIHHKGKDHKQGSILTPAGKQITPAEINIAATIGKYELLVKKLPTMVIISTGDELVDVSEQPEPHQIRRSNVFSIAASVGKLGAWVDILHIDDAKEEISEKLKLCLAEYDVLILSGGVSKGKFDYIPEVLDELGVEKLFHKVAQRPGKPFWFGQTNDSIIFALPGNPVATFMGTIRYVLPWMRQSLGLEAMSPQYARLKEDFRFDKPFQYFLSVKLEMDTDGVTWALPQKGNGSGDLANLTKIDGFLELPMDQDVFSKGQAFPYWGV